eukprot:GHVU01233053.1.p1 GENE.GHVU01233053.1~~GHVU01233053.1.p1  ORF type:complete len:136 (-),score=9.36 GHVU01233053.1:250-657(-)
MEKRVQGPAIHGQFIIRNPRLTTQPVYTLAGARRRKSPRWRRSPSRSHALGRLDGGTTNRRNNEAAFGRHDKSFARVHGTARVMEGDGWVQSGGWQEERHTRATRGAAAFGMLKPPTVVARQRYLLCRIDSQAPR